MLFAPAAGLRIRDTGALANVGTNGYYYSSSPFASGNFYAGFLNFNAGNVNPLNTAIRGDAFPVRCVQHLPKLFLVL